MIAKLGKIGIFGLGLFVGQQSIVWANYFGEKRYSEAIRQCIIEKGPNK